MSGSRTRPTEHFAASGSFLGSRFGSNHVEFDFVVDHTAYGTKSIVATIEQQFGFAPLTST